MQSCVPSQGSYPAPLLQRVWQFLPCSLGRHQLSWLALLGQT